MSKKVKNSHVYISKFILNKFSYVNPKNKKNTISYVDYNTKTIKEASPKKFNTEDSYYTDENEKKLSDYIESEIGKIISIIENKYKKDGLNMIITNHEVYILKKYVAYQIIRTDAMMEYLKDSMATNNNFPYTDEKYKEQLERSEFFSKKSVKELKNIFIAMENNNNTFFDSIRMLGIIIIFNKTKIPFLLNNNPSSILPESIDYFLMNYTISPIIAISLCKKEYLKEALKITDNVYLTEYIDEQVVKNHNKLAYETAKEHKPNILVGDTNELARLLNDTRI